MLVLADVLDGVLRGVLLASLSIVLGSLPWALWVLRGLPAHLTHVTPGRRLRILEIGAAGLALCQVALLALKALVLSESLGPGVLGAFVATAHFTAGARAGRRPPGRLAYMFPVLGAAGGILLLVHSHAAFQLKSSFLVQITHSTMGALAGLMVAARRLELRLALPWRRVAEAAASAAMLAIAFILVFYREANVVVLPPN